MSRRLKSLPLYVNNTIHLMKEGILLGITQPKIVMQAAQKQVPCPHLEFGWWVGSLSLSFSLLEPTVAMPRFMDNPYIFLHFSFVRA